MLPSMGWYDVLSLTLAAVCGALIGIERQLAGKPAGLRTNMLICLGAAAFTVVSHLMGQNSDSTTRIAAQIVTGVGFLGAGAVIQDRGGVHGLTTAATIWLVSSIGMACGARFYLLAIVCTVLALVVLIALAPLAKWLNKIGHKHAMPKHLNENGHDDFIEPTL